MVSDTGANRVGEGDRRWIVVERAYGTVLGVFNSEDDANAGADLADRLGVPLVDVENQ